MKITVKMVDDTVVICSKCKWSGCIDLANWIPETEYGYCPKCGSSEFDDLESWEQADYDDHVHDNISCEDAMFGEPMIWPWEWTWTWTGWKARVAVYTLLAIFIIFGAFPWIWGVIDISNAIIKKFGIGI